MNVEEMRAAERSYNKIQNCNQPVVGTLRPFILSESERLHLTQNTVQGDLMGYRTVMEGN